MTVEQIKTELDNAIEQLRIIVDNQEKTLEILLPPSPEENLVKSPVEIESPTGLLVEIQQKLEKINRLVDNIKTKHSYLQDCVVKNPSKYVNRKIDISTVTLANTTCNGRLISQPE